MLYIFGKPVMGHILTYNALKTGFSKGLIFKDLCFSYETLVKECAYPH